jgi:hypothetical protein
MPTLRANEATMERVPCTLGCWVQATDRDSIEAHCFIVGEVAGMHRRSEMHRRAESRLGIPQANGGWAEEDNYRHRRRKK